GVRTGAWSTHAPAPSPRAPSFFGCAVGAGRGTTSRSPPPLERSAFTWEPPTSTVRTEPATPGLKHQTPDPHRMVATVEPMRTRRHERVKPVSYRGESMSSRKLLFVLLAAAAAGAVAAGIAVAGHARGNDNDFQYAVALS